MKCPKCGGQLLPDRDDGAVCLQCGWIPYMMKDKLSLVNERNLHSGNFGNEKHIKSGVSGAKPKRSTINAELSGPGRGRRITERID